MPAPEYDVAIVGAGITGMALASALTSARPSNSHRAGFRLALLDAKPPPLLPEQPPPGVEGFDGRVSSITPASQAMLEGLGAWEGVLARRVCNYRRMQVWDGEGTGEVVFHARELDALALGHIVENRVLAAALRATLNESAIEFLIPASPRGLTVEAGGAVCITLEDGRKLRAGLLVAADGALSPTRRLAGFKTREWDYGHHALIATVKTERSHQGTAYQRFLDTGPLAFLPLASFPESAEDCYCSIVWSAPPERITALLAMGDSAFCRELGAALEFRLGSVTACSPRASFPLRQRHGVDYVQPGIALAGDAAHTIHPLAGQGINLGLRDAAVLAEELLRGRARGEAPGDFARLRRYQRRRKSDNLLMMAAMDGFQHLFAARALPVRWLRNTGMRLFADVAPLKRWVMRYAAGMVYDSPPQRRRRQQ